MKAKKSSKEKLARDVKDAMKDPEIRMGIREFIRATQRREVELPVFLEQRLHKHLLLNIPRPIIISMKDKNRRVLLHVKEWKKDPEFRKALKDFIKATTS